MKEILNEYKFQLILVILCFLGLMFFTGHYSNILIDFGREVYYPEQILNGKILYKDLFNIYGPLSYQINAVLYKIFGIKLSTLYFAGGISSLLVINGIYLIANKFLNRFLSFCLAIFTLTVGVTTSSIFNFHFPYSWGVLYGLIAFIYSLYFILNFNENKKPLNLYLSSFLAGFCITCKYDFILFAIIILFFIFKNRNLKAFLCFLTIPIFSFGILFMQGLSISDLLNSFEIVKKMAVSNTLTYFYQNSGIYFHKKIISTQLILFIKFIVPFAGIILGSYLFKKNKIISLVVLKFAYVAAATLLIHNHKIAFAFMPVLILISALFSYKRINTSLLILLCSALAVSTKTFWLLLIQSYGTYYIPVIFIAFFALLFQYLPKNFQRNCGVYVLLASIIILGKSIKDYKLVNYKIETPKGYIYTTKNLATSSTELINSNLHGKIVIFPEGMTINFLTNTQSDDFYNSFLPLYAETFGEEKFIEHYKTNMPEYFIFNNLNMKDYYFEYICKDYGLKFCAFVQENYLLDKVIDNNFRYLIFKRK